ncbi:alanine--tRNA ligase-related protein, partial [Patescibacteria group bacterium]
MTTDQIRKAYLDFFKDKGHAIIPPAPLVPPDDPTTLFTGSGMQQLVPYLKGEPHPMGKRLADSQPCFRAEDIEEVGDNRHTTFFEMLGNWSLGDYFKQDQLSWIWEFLTEILKLPKEKITVTISAGGLGIPKDNESEKTWLSLGLPKEKIIAYPIKEENWWSRAGSPDKMPVNEIGGQDSEVFFEFTDVKHNKKFGEKCHPNCDCGRFLEIANSVFIEYVKTGENKFEPLPNKNVDFGGGLERLAAAVNNNPDIFQIDVFQPTIKKLETITAKKYQDDNLAPMRVIADHLRAADAMLKQGLEPSNKLQGYTLRRLIRRSAVKMRQLKGALNSKDFESLIKNQPLLIQEIEKFQKSLNKGLSLIDKTDPQKINAQFAFNLFQTYGFPLEITQEILSEKGIKLDKKQLETEKQKHSDLSKTASDGMFKGGLADKSEEVTKLHTATHLLHQSLRQVLGDHVKQQGSNITAERLRFDFTHDQALTDNEVDKIEKLINQQIKKD